MRQGLLTIAMLVVVWLAWMLRDLVILVGFAALLAYALEPVVTEVARLKFERTQSCCLRAEATLVVQAP